MCGRISQKGDYSEYAELVRWNPAALVNLQADGLRYNVPPGARPMVLHRVARLRILEAAADQSHCGASDGWFEWTGEKGDKQPWFISARDSEAILMAGITA